MEDKKLFLKCVCSSHGLEIVRVKDEDIFELSIWNQCYNGTIKGFGEKLRWCWRILKTGNPWADAIVLSNNDSKKLADFILNNVKNQGI